jgi:3-oxoacyl-[acyl-carrier protein] reductase
MTDEGPLAGKTALVTGGSRGIGAETVRRLASDGADIAFTYNTGIVEADEVAASVRALGRAVLAIHADFADVNAPADVVRCALKEFGRLDILVNNAGVTFWRPIAQMDAESFDRIVAIDVRAPYLLMKEAAGGALSDGGRVINIASGVTSSAVPGSSLYSGAKAFIDQLTKVAALEFASRRITVNAVGPRQHRHWPVRRPSGRAPRRDRLRRLPPRARRHPRRHRRPGCLPRLRPGKFHHRPGHLQHRRPARPDRPQLRSPFTAPPRGPE